MIFHIEGNSKWAFKFNSQNMKCHEKIGNCSRSNFLSDELNEDDLESTFIDLFIRVAENVE
jgi:hypothetical protein